jgi:hypothetical protein
VSASTGVDITPVRIDNLTGTGIVVTGSTQRFCAQFWRRRQSVRTAYFNAVGMNSLLDNNDGASSAFHFFGIEPGAPSGVHPNRISLQAEATWCF